MANEPVVAYYVTAHGYGHGVRSCDIIRAINAARPEVRVMIVTGLPAPFLTNRLQSGAASIRPGAFDVGMVQLDSIRVDVPATFGKARALLARWEELIRQESGFLEKEGVRAVVADIPAIPLQAAVRTGIPAIAVGNFGWDFIYADYRKLDPGWGTICAAFAEGYARADLLLRLPFHEEMRAFRNVEDIPLVASPGRPRRREIADLTGARPGLRWILLSFTTLDWDGAALENVERMEGYEFFTVRPLCWERRNIHAIDRQVVPFSDVIASVDAVLSKPGYGVLSECVANSKPLIYAERTEFAEYPVLEEAVRRHLRHLHIPAESLYRGDLQAALDGIWSRPPLREAMPLGGDFVAARRILRFM